ncbi:MAG: hypothetical protein R3B82_19965, partial [Sandaracinaceae bacterium]
MMRTRARDPRLLLALWVFQLVAYFIPAATWSPTSRYALTHALVELHSAELGRWGDATGDRARVGEAWYSDKAPLPA